MENMSESEASSSIDHDLSTSELSFDFEKHSESLNCDYEDLDSWLLRKNLPIRAIISSSPNVIFWVHTQ